MTLCLSHAQVRSDGRSRLVGRWWQCHRDHRGNPHPSPLPNAAPHYVIARPPPRTHAYRWWLISMTAACVELYLYTPTVCLYSVLYTLIEYRVQRNVCVVVAQLASGSWPPAYRRTPGGASVWIQTDSSIVDCVETSQMGWSMLCSFVQRAL